MKIISIAVTLLLLISGCVGMPISSMFKLRNLDPLETDPAQISIAVITNNAVVLNDNSTSLTMGFKSDLPEHNFENTFFTIVVTNPNIQVLQDNKNDDENITLFFMDEKSAKSMRITQNRIKSIRQLGIEGEGSLAINVNTGCFNVRKPSILLASIYMKFDSEQGFILMNRNVDLIEQSNHTEQQDFWVECDNLPN